MIGDYQKFLAGDFRQQSLLEIPEQEVVFPQKVVFPFAEAFRISLETMKTHVPSDELRGGADAPLPPPVLVISKDGRPLPFVPHSGEDGDDDPEEELPDFRILRSRVKHDGPTKGCPACKRIDEGKKYEGLSHTRACRRKFYTNLKADGWTFKRSSASASYGGGADSCEAIPPEFDVVEKTRDDLVEEAFLEIAEADEAAQRIADKKQSGPALPGPPTRSKSTVARRAA